MNRNEKLQGLIRLYKQESGEKIVDMDKIADWAMKRGATMPKPKTPKELLASQLADAARAEYRQDTKTGFSYRANHAMRITDSEGKQQSLWFDIEEATRPQMLVSLQNRRDQMVGDAVHLKIDEQIWNDRNPDQQPIQLVIDFTDDVQERFNAPGYGSGEAA